MSTQSLVHRSVPELLLMIDKVIIKMANDHVLYKRFLLGKEFCKSDFMLLCDFQDIIKSPNCDIKGLVSEIEENLNSIILKYL